MSYFDTANAVLQVHFLHLVCSCPGMCGGSHFLKCVEKVGLNVSIFGPDVDQYKIVAD